MLSSWSAAWRERPFRIALIAAAVVAVPIAWGLPRFFTYIEGKPGIGLIDPILLVIGPVDVTWITFTVLYATIVLSVARALPQPWLIVRGLHAYALLQPMRMIAMATFTLEPPADIIPLIDPVTAVFYPRGVPFLKDLFFSGHTATLLLMVYLAQGRAARTLTVIATVAVGFLVILQHVHWTVDVLAAPFFVWLAWKGSAFTLRACGVRGA